MPDPQSNALAELEASAVLLADLAGCAVRLDGKPQTPLITALRSQMIEVERLIASSTHLS